MLAVHECKRFKVYVKQQANPATSSRASETRFCRQHLHTKRKSQVARSISADDHGSVLTHHYNGNGNGTSYGASVDSHGASGSAAAPLHKDDYSKFVQLFRQASPYIEGHRGRTFVVVIPGTVTGDRALLNSTLSDIAMLHGLGINLVVVTCVQEVVDSILRERHMEPKYVGAYRITDQKTMRIAVEALGEVRTQVEQALSKGPAIPMIRRHTKGEGEMHFAPALNVVSGNYLAAKRRGVVHGVDFGLTGEVRFVLKEAIKKQLEMGNIVLLNQMGYTAAGEVLNCSAFDVGLHAAVGLGADKLFCLHLDEVAELGLPAWLSLSDAQEMLKNRVEGLLNTDDMDDFVASMTSPQAAAGSSSSSTEAAAQLGSTGRGTGGSGTTSSSSSVSSSVLGMPQKDALVNLDIWNDSGFPLAVSTCVISCCKGVKRAHLLDARVDGGLLLELYTRDGVGTMISADFYEGIRKARDSDVDSLHALLEPLVHAGVLVARTKAELGAMVGDFIVVERETKLMGCAMLLPLGKNEDGVEVAELGAFCVDSAFRGSGRGDSMLDYVEQEAVKQGIRALVLLTTRTADWFEQRDFQFRGPAFLSPLLPESRRARVNPARNSQLYVKELLPCDGRAPQPGKRIGF